MSESATKGKYRPSFRRYSKRNHGHCWLGAEWVAEKLKSIMFYILHWYNGFDGKVRK